MQRSFVLIAATVMALSAQGADSSKDKSKKSLSRMTCEEFLALDVEVQPRFTYWAVGYIDDEEPEDAWIDVDATESLVPVMVTECRKAPKESFWSKLKATFHKERSL